MELVLNQWVARLVALLTPVTAPAVADRDAAPYADLHADGDPDEYAHPDADLHADCHAAAADGDTCAAATGGSCRIGRCSCSSRGRSCAQRTAQAYGAVHPGRKSAPDSV